MLSAFFLCSNTTSQPVVRGLLVVRGNLLGGTRKITKFAFGKKNKIYGWKFFCWKKPLKVVRELKTLETVAVTYTI